MRPSNKQRSRNKQGNGGGHNSNNNQRQRMGNIINRVFESAGPDGKVRGTPQQIIDKYQALARDAQVSGDRVAAESFLQHSEHYSRLLGEAQRHQNEQREREEAGRPDRPQDGGFRPQPAPQPSFGFGAIDEDEEPAGLIDTPEGRSEQPQLRPVPAPEPTPAPWRDEPPAPAPVEAAPPPPVEAAPAETVQAETPPSPPEPAAAEEPPAPRRGRPRRRKTEPAEPKGETAAVAE